MGTGKIKKKNPLGRYVRDKTGEIREEPDILAWAEWLGKADRHVGETTVEFGSAKVLVSTVFLGIDYDFTREGPPVLFETMVFNGAHDGYQERYCSEEEARAGHERIVRMVKEE